jgi:hypothetical protein
MCFVLATSRLCSRGACPSLPRILPLVNGLIFGSGVIWFFTWVKRDLFQTNTMLTMLLKYIRAAGQRVLSPLDWSSNFMGEGRKEGRTRHCHCMWQLSRALKD